MRLDRSRVATFLLVAALVGGARLASAADINVTLPTVSGIPGSLVDVPITVSPSPAGRGIVSIDFRLAFDPAFVAASQDKADGFLQTWGPAFWNGTSTFLAAAAAGSTPISTTGTLLNTAQVRIKPSAVIGTSTPLTFQHILFNEGTPTVAVTNGLLQVVAPGASVPEPGARAFALMLASPNPVRGSAAFTYALPGTGPGRLAIYGVDGRLVRAIELCATTGMANVSWDLRDATGARVRPGVYLARLVRGSDARSCRAVVLD